MGQTLPSSLGAARPLPPSEDIGPGGQSVGQAAQFCLAATRHSWLSKVQSVDQRMRRNAVSAFANCGGAVAHVRGRYGTHAPLVWAQSPSISRAFLSV